MKLNSGLDRSRALNPLRHISRWAAASPISSLAFLSLSAFGLVYLAFQKKLFSRETTRIVAKLLFYPTYPLTALLRLGNLWTPLDDTVVLGCAPMALLNHPSKLYSMGVRGVVNMCDEYDGPVSEYDRLGIVQLRLPTVDHYESSLKQLQTGVAFIAGCKARGDKVFVHCKAGHGRAAAMALCWLLHSNPRMSAKVDTTSEQLSRSTNTRVGCE